MDQLLVRLLTPVARTYLSFLQLTECAFVCVTKPLWGINRASIFGGRLFQTHMQTVLSDIPD